MSISWLEESVEMLRILINDFSDNPTYSDNTLEQVLLTAARYVAQEIKLDYSYTVSFLNATVDPDPATDDIFVNMTVLKAACLTNTWQFNSQAIIQGIKAKLGPGEISVNANGDILLALITRGPCEIYENLKLQQNFSNIGNIRAILSPFTSNDFEAC